MTLISDFTGKGNTVGDALVLLLNRVLVPATNPVRGGLVLELFDITSGQAVPPQESADLTVFAVQQTTGDNVLLGSLSGYRQTLRIGEEGLDKLTYFDSASFASDPVATDRAKISILAVRKTGTLFEWFENGNSLGTTAVDPGAEQFDYIGGTGSDGTLEYALFSGSVPELLAYSRALSGSEFIAVQTYLAAKHGL